MRRFFGLPDSDAGARDMAALATKIEVMRIAPAGTIADRRRANDMRDFKEAQEELAHCDEQLAIFTRRKAEAELVLASVGASEAITSGPIIEASMADIEAAAADLPEHENEIVGTVSAVEPAISPARKKPTQIASDKTVVAMAKAALGAVE